MGERTNEPDPEYFLKLSQLINRYLRGQLLCARHFARLWGVQK